MIDIWSIFLCEAEMVDSNPRTRRAYRISSATSYDLLSTSPNLYIITQSKRPAQVICRSFNGG